MKAQFKYTLLAGLHIRGIVFLVIFLMNLAFIILGAFGVLPLAANVTAVVFAWVGMYVMFIANVVSDIGIIRRLFSAPNAYLSALTPLNRGKTLLASVIAITIMDVVSMAVAISGATWLSLRLVGNFFDIFGFIRNVAIMEFSYTVFSLGSVLLLISGYLLVLMFIIACVAVRKSLFYQKRAGKLLTVAVAIGAMYVISISPLLLVPFGTVHYNWGFFHISFGVSGMFAYGVLSLVQAFVLFIIASKLMERKLNI